MNIYYREGKIIDIKKDVKVIYDGPIIITFRGFRDIQKVKDEICEILNRYYGVIHTQDTDSIYVADIVWNWREICNFLERKYNYRIERVNEDSKLVYQIQSVRYHKLSKNSLKRKALV